MAREVYMPHDVELTNVTIPDKNFNSRHDGFEAGQTALETGQTVLQYVLLAPPTAFISHLRRMSSSQWTCLA